MFSSFYLFSVRSLPTLRCPYPQHHSSAAYSPGLGFNAYLSKVPHWVGLFRDTYFYLASYDKSLFQFFNLMPERIGIKLQVRFELTIFDLEGRRSNQLSYCSKIILKGVNNQTPCIFTYTKSSFYINNI